MALVNQTKEDGTINWTPTRKVLFGAVTAAASSVVIQCLRVYAPFLATPEMFNLVQTSMTPLLTALVMYYVKERG